MRIKLIVIIFVKTAVEQNQMESVSPALVRGLLAAGNSYKAIAQELKVLYPQISRGFSERSIRRYVKENNLRGLADQDVQEVVQESVSEV